MFGWHVHEKAILMAIIPLTLITWESEKNSRLFFFLSVVGNYSLFPLLFKPNLTVIKLSMYLVYIALAYYYLKIQRKFPFLEKMYLIGLGVLFIYEHLIYHVLEMHKNLPFLPLMLTSVYCAVGITYFWLIFYYDYLRESEIPKDKKKSK